MKCTWISKPIRNTPLSATATTFFCSMLVLSFKFPGGNSTQLANMMKDCPHTSQHLHCLPGTHTGSKCPEIRLLGPTLPSRVLRPLSSPFLCLEVELPLVLWLPSFPLPVPLDKEVEDWLTVLFRLGCSALGVRWRPDIEGEGTGSSFFSKDLLDLMGYESSLQCIRFSTSQNMNTQRLNINIPGSLTLRTQQRCH